MGRCSGTMVDLGIVIVSYNTRDLLRACLRSVYASRGDFTFEVCVVDNASRDGSAEMVAAEFPQVRLIANRENVGYPAANNQALRTFGFTNHPTHQPTNQPTNQLTNQLTNHPAFALLLNSDTELPPDAIARMLAFMNEHPDAGIAGPKVVLPNGSLDLACRRSFPTPEISFYRMTLLSRIFPRSRRFGRYNLTYLDPDQLTEVDCVMGAFMLLRAEAIAQAGLMDEQFFMYGEDLDWAYRIKALGWKVYYNPSVSVLHVKRASTRQNPRAQIEFYRAMEVFYRKHYAATTSRWLHRLIVGSIRLRQRLERMRFALTPRRRWRICP